MKAVCLRKTEEGIAEPDLHHEPHYARDSPIIGTYVGQHSLVQRGTVRTLNIHCLPSVQRVKSRPEKHTAAMHMKKANSAIIPRSALTSRQPSDNNMNQTWNQTHRMMTLFLIAKNARRGNNMQAPQARMSNAKSDAQAACAVS